MSPDCADDSFSTELDDCERCSLEVGKHSHSPDTWDVHRRIGEFAALASVVRRFVSILDLAVEASEVSPASPWHRQHAASSVQQSAPSSLRRVASGASFICQTENFASGQRKQRRAIWSVVIQLRWISG